MKKINNGFKIIFKKDKLKMKTILNTCEITGII